MDNAHGLQEKDRRFESWLSVRISNLEKCFKKEVESERVTSWKVSHDGRKEERKKIFIFLTISHMLTWHD